MRLELADTWLQRVLAKRNLLYYSIIKKVFLERLRVRNRLTIIFSPSCYVLKHTYLAEILLCGKNRDAAVIMLQWCY